MRSFVDSVLSRLNAYGDTTATREAPFAEESLRRRILAPTDRLCGMTDVGPCRPNNEDNFYLAPDGQLWVVADGMGGQAAGELASALAIEAIVESVNSSASQGSDSSPGTSLPNAFALAQERVLNYGTQHEECKGMGCAVLAAHIEGDLLHVCHVGDVRCYVWSAGTLERFTEDHSVVGHLLEMGMLTSEQARQHQDRGRLRQAVGLPRGIKPDLNSRRLNYGDRVLLCSDGLWDALPEDEIAAVFASQGSMRQLSTVLVDRAIAAGADDNITAVLYEHKA